MSATSSALTASAVQNRLSHDALCILTWFTWVMSNLVFPRFGLGGSISFHSKAKPTFSDYFVASAEGGLHVECECRVRPQPWVSSIGGRSLTDCGAGACQVSWALQRVRPKIPLVSLYPSAGIARVYHHTQLFLHRFWGWNSGPQVLGKNFKD